MKYSALLSRIEKPKPSPKKRRRPSKKLVATLESLAEALPNTLVAEENEAIVGQAKIRHRSLKSKPGAMKRKERIISMEKDRFNRNMAQMAVGDSGVSDPSASGGAGPSTAGTTNSRWAALRGFIRHTVESRIGMSASSAN